MGTYTYKVLISDLEAVLTLTNEVSGIRASGILFDENAYIVDETESRLFIGYCHMEIVYALAGDLMVTRCRIESQDVWDAICTILPECGC